MTLFLELVAVAALVLLNGFFVAAEYALVTVRRTRLQELDAGGQPPREAGAADHARSRPRFIAAMQLGVTVTSLAIGALGEHALTRVFDPVMATVLAVVLALLLLTFFHVVAGELVPKGMALGYSEQNGAVASRRPCARFFFVFKPLIWFLQRSSDVTLRAARAGAAGRRRRRLLGGRAEDAARALDGRGRARAGGAGDALQGLRLRRQGGRRT